MNCKLQEGIQMPTRAHSSDAGLDLYSPVDITIEPGKCSDRINTGFALEIPNGFYGKTTERSSQGKKGIFTIGNIVDAGYTGFIHVTLVNSGSEIYEIKKGDRICQFIVMPVVTFDLVQVEEFNETERGNGAHGSTGV